MSYKVAGIDIHKKVLMVVIADAALAAEDWEWESRRFTTGAQERKHLVAWLQERGVAEIVMESTAQYWKPVWLELEPHFGKLHLAQAHSNRAPKGRKHDFGDAQRLTRRLVAGELMLSYVPGAEQRGWRTITRAKWQLVRDRVRLQNQLEALLEEARIKLSSVISELLGQSGRRILEALAEGQRDPAQLAALGDFRLHCSQSELADALNAPVGETHRQMLALFLERLGLLDRQIQRLDYLAAEALKEHQDAVVRLAGVPGFGPDSAQRMIAELGPRAATFPTPGELASWVGICPGSNITAEVNGSTRCPKGNPFVRHLLTQAAQAAVKKKGSIFQITFRRWLPKLTYNGAIWAIAHKLCRVVWKVLHDGVQYIERGQETSPAVKRRRVQKMIRILREMGYKVEVAPLSPATSAG